MGTGVRRQRARCTRSASTGSATRMSRARRSRGSMVATRCASMSAASARVSVLFRRPSGVRTNPILTPVPALRADRL